MNAILVTGGAGYIGALCLLAALPADGGADGGCTTRIHPAIPGML